jgi:6-pyruvoyltetrahydropterin/6-carboxytetrahydropterin synthase
MGSSTGAPRVAVTRHEHFNAAHRIHNPALSDADNSRIYGKCNNPSFHGHNYELIVRVTGPLDPVIGYVIDLGELSAIVKRDVPEFRNVNPTAENIAIVIHDLIRPHLADHLELNVTLGETPRNFVHYPATSGA